MPLGPGSTGLVLFGQGGWCAAKHGRARRRRMKLHLGVDATTGEAGAHVLAGGHADDAAQVPDPLRQPGGDIASPTADGAYDGDRVRRAAAARQPGRPPDVVIPPRAPAVPSTADADEQGPRDRHVHLVAEHGRMAWQRMTGYDGSNAAKTAAGRHGHLTGSGLRGRNSVTQAGEVGLAIQVPSRMARQAKTAHRAPDLINAGWG